MIIIRLLFLDCGNKAENTVDYEECAADDKQDIKSVSECKRKTDKDRKDRKYNCENGFLLASESVDESDNALDREKDSENEKNDIGYKPTEYQNNGTDYDADSAATPVFLYKIKNTRNNENNARDSHCPVKCLRFEYYQKNTENKVEQGGEQTCVCFFVCHNVTPFL